MIFFQEGKKNLEKTENKASLHKVKHGLFKLQFSHFPMNINDIANQAHNKKWEIQCTLKVENKGRGDALPKRLVNRGSKSSLYFFLFKCSLKKKSQIPHFVIFNFPSMKCYTNTFLHCHFQYIMHKSELKRAVNLFKREVRKKRRGQES